MSGRNVMMGYLFCEDKTKEAIDKDGWLHSGKSNARSLYMIPTIFYLFSNEDLTIFISLHSSTGDIGCIDDNGYLKITGRIKEILITAGGENVPPLLIEDAIKEALPCISNVMVVGDKKKFLCCLLTMKGMR